MDKVYWHKLSREEQIRFIEEKTKDRKLTIKEFMQMVKQPDWCDCPNAMEGIMGCWGLFFGYIHNKGDCKNCEFYNKNWRSKKCLENYNKSFIS